jgi:squalene-hopene/tetraprenyl-beta-curcumene cyclase
MALDALSASGLKQDHEAYARAIKFLERCQNRSESNDIQILEEGVIIQSGEDGGAGYAPGSSKAEYEITTRDGKRVKVPRSYGSMTYALFKCYLLAGLDRQDPRVQAAWHWLGQNWTLDQNPGFEASRDPSAAYQGLFYYYQGMARALALSGSEEITDAEGVVHAWRTELSARIVTLQNRIDGSWVNQNAPRWWEGNPVLATSYALSTLDACRVR